MSNPPPSGIWPSVVPSWDLPISQAAPWEVAEACASHMVLPSPGPLALSPWGELVGRCRPNFEVHLTRDPLAMSLFPKPELAATHCGSGAPRNALWLRGVFFQTCGLNIGS